MQKYFLFRHSHLLSPSRSLSRLFVLVVFSFLTACAGADKDEMADFSAKQLYEEARSDIFRNEFQQAVKTLETLEARYPFSPYAKQAQLDIAYAYYKSEDTIAALSALERFERLHPRDSHLDYVYYLKGLANFNHGKGLLESYLPRDSASHDGAIMKQSFENFATLIQRFPNSQYIDDAQTHMIYLKNQMAKKEIHIAQYYLARKSWLASANRAKTVIKNYPNTPSVIPALEIMTLSYQKLGLKKLASDSQRLLDYNRTKATDSQATDSQASDS